MFHILYFVILIVYSLLKFLLLDTAQNVLYFLSDGFNCTYILCGFMNSPFR